MNLIITIRVLITSLLGGYVAEAAEIFDVANAYKTYDETSFLAIQQEGKCQ